MPHEQDALPYPWLVIKSQRRTTALTLRIQQWDANQNAWFYVNPTTEPPTVTWDRPLSPPVTPAEAPTHAQGGYAPYGYDQHQPAAADGVKTGERGGLTSLALGAGMAMLGGKNNKHGSGYGSHSVGSCPSPRIT